jgi:hypothetical protein
MTDEAGVVASKPIDIRNVPVDENGGIRSETAYRIPVWFELRKNGTLIREPWQPYSWRVGSSAGECAYVTIPFPDPTGRITLTDTTAPFELPVRIENPDTVTEATVVIDEDAHPMIQVFLDRMPMRRSKVTRGENGFTVETIGEMNSEEVKNRDPVGDH